MFARSEADDTELTNAHQKAMGVSVFIGKHFSMAGKPTISDVL
jgi:hypothetical protein